MADSIDRIGLIQAQVHDLISKYRLAVGELEQQANVVAEQDRKVRELSAQLKALRSENEELRLLISFNGDAAARAKLAKQLQNWSREINQVISKLQP
jgi:outer membrane murein-binding lipoprotein Lpp